MNTFFTLPEKISYRRPTFALPVGVLFVLMLLADSIAAQDVFNTNSTPTNNYATVGQFVFIDMDGNGKRDAFDIPLPNSTVTLYDSSNNVLATRITNSNGYFLFDSIRLPHSGLNYFKLKFDSPSPNYTFTTQNAEGSDSSTASIADPISGYSSLFTMEAGQVKLTLNAGFKAAAGVLLPATINQFTGAYANGFVELGWKALINSNIKHFDIERSIDGINFRQIGQVIIDEDNITNNNFTYLDILAEKGSNFYRLVIVDKDGNYNYSKVITISVEAKGISLMVVYPNPFSKRVQVKIDCDKAEQVTIRITDNFGKIARSQTSNLQKGENRMAINNVDELPGGFYYLEVIAKDRKMRIKLMKQQ